MTTSCHIMSIPLRRHAECLMLRLAFARTPKLSRPPLVHAGLPAMSRIDVAYMASLDSMAVAVGSPSARTRFAAGGN